MLGWMSPHEIGATGLYLIIGGPVYIGGRLHDEFTEIFFDVR